MLNQLLNNPFLYSLSLTLVHFLWQGLLVGLILKSALLLIDKKKSKLRYGLSTLAMLSNAILATFTFIIIYSESGSGSNGSLSGIPFTSLVRELSQQNTMLTYQEFVPSILVNFLPYISLIWLATIVILAAKLLIEVQNVHNLSKSACVSPTEDLLARFDELAKQIRLSKTPTFLISLKAEVPMAIGWLKPVVLFPASMVTGLDSIQLEMLILHELAHIRRHDYLVNFFQTLIELVFFFHPSVHWIGKQMRNEREYCSDDIAVQHSGDPIAYARTLTDTASLCAKRCTNKHAHTIPTMAMAASGGDLKERVLRLVDHHCTARNDSSKWLVAISTLLALTIFSVNQLLTIPFANSINNQLSSQDRSLVKADSFIFSSKSAPKVNVSTDSSTSLIRNNSIAAQLLPPQINNNQALLIESRTLKADNNSKIVNDLISTSTPSSLENSPASVTANVSTSNNEGLNPNIAREEVAITNLASKKTLTSTAAKSNNIRLAEATDTNKMSLFNKEQHLTSSQPAQTSASLNLVNLPSIPVGVKTHQKLNYAEKNNALPHAVNFTDKQHTSQAELTLEQPTKPTHVANQTLNEPKAKTTPYSKISYSQEINNLASDNTLYEASHPINSILDNGKAKSEKTIISHKAKLLDSIRPEYPTLAKRRGIEMEVKVNFTIDRNGKVKDIYFDEKNKISYFKSAVRSAVSKWRFTPATENNDIIESKMSKIFSFSLQS